MSPEGVADTLARVRAEQRSAVAEYETAVARRADRWVPACGGLETPFVAGGVQWLYVFNPSTGDHGYYRYDSDVVVSDYNDYL
jgi:hypothetical protein